MPNFRHLLVGEPFTYQGPSKNAGPYIKVGRKLALDISPNSRGEDAIRVPFKPRTEVISDSARRRLCKDTQTLFPWPPEAKENPSATEQINTLD